MFLRKDSSLTARLHRFNFFVYILQLHPLSSPASLTYCFVMSEEENGFGDEEDGNDADFGFEEEEHDEEQFRAAAADGEDLNAESTDEETEEGGGGGGGAAAEAEP